MRFDEFLQRDFIEAVTEDTLSLRFSIKDPSSYGITDYEVSWGELGVYPSKETLRRDREAIKEFKAFNREDLTKEQRESYDIYAYFAALYESSLDTYILYDPLTGANGFHATIPIVMSEFQFQCLADIEEYLQLTEQFGLLIESQIDYQKERARLRLFMSDSAADEVIKACEDLMADQVDNIFKDSFISRLEGVSGLDEAKKAELIEYNGELFDSVIVPAYETLASEIKALKGSGVNEGGLANFKKGKAYYRNELLMMGIDKTPERLIEDCDALLREYLIALYTAIQANQWIIDELDNRLTTDRDAAEILNHLKTKSKEHFPALPDSVGYSLKTIDESVRDVLSAGFYFMPRLDDYALSSIYYNPDYFGRDRDYMFFLFAHEGYPGHLLQRVSVLAGSLSDWRKTVRFKAYTEGWAQYVQYFSYRYADEDSLLTEVKRLEEEMDLLLSMRVDLGVHYEGWTVEEMKVYLAEHLPYEMSDAGVGGFYAFTVKNPLQAVPYYGGVMGIRELEVRYRESLGENFDEKQFHEELLKYGAAPFSLLRDWMDEALLGGAVETQAA